MELLKLSEVGVETAAAHAAAVLRMGGLVVYPTDTLYGLGAHLDHPDAIRRLHELKGRNEAKFLSFVVFDMETAGKYAVVTDSARGLAEKFLPGALTLKLTAREKVPAAVAHDGAIRFRIPNDTFALALAQELGAPYSATSANVSGEETKSTVEEILAQFGERAAHIDLVIDDGPRAGGVPSTIVSCVGTTVEIIREGAISSEELFS